MKKLFLFAIVALGFTAVSFGQTTTANAAAKITTALSISNSNDINFAAIVPSGTTGTVTVLTTGTRTKTGGVTLTSGGGTSAAATFTVVGALSAGFNITLPVSALTITNGGIGTMTVDSWSCDAGTSSTLDATNGEKIIKIGATLNVGMNQATGQYLGAAGFPITVAYN